MSKTGRYMVINGELVKISDKARISTSILWPGHNDPGYNGFTTEHLGNDPVHVSTKRQLRYEMEKRGIAQKEA